MAERGRYAETLDWEPSLVSLPHLNVSGLDMAREALGVEERAGALVVLQLLSDRLKLRWRARQPPCQPLVLAQRRRNELRNADGAKMARPDTAREAFTQTCDDGQTDPEGVAGRRVRIVRQGVEKQVGQPLARQMLPMRRNSV